MRHQLVALATAMTTTGCSFIFVKGPTPTGDPPAYYPQDCTDSMTWPVVDGVLTGLGVLLAAVPADSCGDGNGTTGPCSSSDRAQQITSGIVTAVIFAASAFYGYSKASSCREARGKYAAAHPEAPYGPQIMPYGGGYPAPYGYQQPYQQPQAPATYGPPPVGGEGQACIVPANTCNPGLLCASDLCVRDPNAPAPPPAPLAPPAPPPPAPTAPVAPAAPR